MEKKHQHYEMKHLQLMDSQKALLSSGAQG